MTAAERARAIVDEGWDIETAIGSRGMERSITAAIEAAVAENRRGRRLGDAELEKIRASIVGPDEERAVLPLSRLYAGYLRVLFAHVDFLAALLRDATSEGAYARGWQDACSACAALVLAAGDGVRLETAIAKGLSQQTLAEAILARGQKPGEQGP